ncbi:MAG: amino acid permease [Chitinophagales bacterium]|nr:amino acid permease [Chitinophagales bacterium]
MNFSQLFRKKSVNQILKDVEQGYSDGEGGTGLTRTLKVRDLTFFGIAAIIGAGIFGTIGQASFDGGPAVSLLFVFIAVACGFAALCYAEFASMIPIAGSAYTYSYVAFGELVAWIIGWDLLMEYSIGNITVALSWSSYFETFIGGFGLHLPSYLTSDIISSYHAFEAGSTTSPEYQAWVTAPRIGSFPLIADIPALFITIFITCLIYIGIKESRTASNLMVMLKLTIVVVVILIGIFYINPSNWHPFLPNGVSGVLKGVAAVFFAYIGFDAISTTAEECENPQRDLPKGMIYALIICTVLYIIMSLVLTGMTSYKNLGVQDPLADVFKNIPSLNWLAGVIAFSAIIATTSVFLVFQLGQPRIWMSMSRDGLLPKKFASIHPKYHTPAFSTVMTGFLVAVPLLFLNFTLVTNLTSIGTLFAFALVCGGVLIMHEQKDLPQRKFKVWYINGKYIIPLMFLTLFFLMYLYNRETLMDFIFFKNSSDTTSNAMSVGKENLPYWIFIIYAILISWYSYKRNLSLIPVLGLSMCIYLMSALTTTTWIGFTIWLIIGLVIYFLYSFKNSRLHTETRI